MTLCSHMQRGPYPFATLLVLDDHLGPTESLVRCLSCGRAYLLEMLDWLNDERLFRVRAVDADTAQSLVRDLQRGSCDLTRAGEEARHVSLSSERLPALMLLNTRTRELTALLTGPETLAAPGTSWRGLPCDGAWIRKLQPA